MNPLTIDDLPNEILSKIFKLFPLKDRKQARLVCNRWNDVLLRKAFTDTEIFYLDLDCKFSIIDQMLEGYTRPTFNLRIVQINWGTNVTRGFSDSEEEFFQKWGPKIESLHLLWCRLSTPILEGIFTYCVNLKEFSAENCQENLGENWYSTTPPKCNLSFLSRLKRKNLRKFLVNAKEKARPYHFALENFNFLAAAFPRIEVLEIHHISLIGEVQPMLHNALARMTHLKSVVIGLHSSTQEWKKYSDFDWNGSKPIRMTLTDHILCHENLDTVLNYNYWASLNVMKINSHPNLDELIVVRLLIALPQLQEFKIDIDGPVNMQTMKTLLPAMVHSNLQSLYFDISCRLEPPTNCTNNEVADAFTFLDSLVVVNNSVRCLSILRSGYVGTGYWEEDSFLYGHINEFFFKHFLAVRDLRVHVAEKVDLAFRYQKHLEFVIFECGRLNTRRQKEKSRSNDESELNDKLGVENKLEPLEVPSLKCLFLHCQEERASCLLFFSAYRFPNLKCFILYEENEGYSDGELNEMTTPILSAISSNCPQLEFFQITYQQGVIDFFAYVEILKSFCQFKQLRYVSLKKPCFDEDIEPVNWELIDEIKLTFLGQCPRLRISWFPSTGLHRYNNLDSKQLTPHSIRRPNTIYTHSRMPLNEHGGIPWRTDRRVK